ncbi:ScpA/B protein [uncultured spirochete]|uniref:Segregation and condensation protein A n=1 Tax=uncultured spirochete TaxID=156406 RepID=A0A3P3XTN0_9SPIR|nr:ScpA/B protein [uncultured spirochete]
MMQEFDRDFSKEQIAILSNGRTFHLSDFEGPLDLLLYLIKKNEMNIYDIHLSSITEQFLECLNSDSSANLDEISEFYQMAATLLYIKSRSLLPHSDEDLEEIEDPRRTLIDQLIEYHRFKKLSELMEQREMEVEWFVERSTSQRPLPFVDNPDDDPWIPADSWDLLRTFASMIRHFNSERIIDLYEEVSINEKIVLINELLSRKGSFRFDDLIAKHASALDLACAFLAVLDATKNRIIRIRQHRLFGDILIIPYAEAGDPHE